MWTQPPDAEDGIHVRTVEIKQSAATMHELRNLFDLTIEQPQRVWIGDHKGHRTFIEMFAQVIDIDIPRILEEVRVETFPEISISLLRKLF